METTRCPHCNEELSRIEMLDGRCVNCGQEFARAASTSHGEPDESPYHASASIDEPLSRKQWIAIALLAVFLVTLATPFGLVYSCYVGLQKGDSICAHPGCTNDSQISVEYGTGVKRGYCDVHVKEPQRSVSAKQLKVPYVLCAIALVFMIHFAMAFKEAYTGKVSPSTDPNKKLRIPFRYFVYLSLTGIVVINGFFWLMSRYVC